MNPVGVCLHLYVRFVSKPEQLFSLLQTLYRTENQKTAWLELVGVSLIRLKYGLAAASVFVHVRALSWFC